MRECPSSGLPSSESSRASRQPALPGMERKNPARSLVALKRGQQVKIRVRTGPGAGTYPASVLDQSSESLLVWTWARDWDPNSISLDTAVDVGFGSPRGWAQFHSRVTGLCIRDCVIEIMVAAPGRVKYLQRRKYPRLAAVLPIRAWPAGSGDAPRVPISGHTHDIAEGGLGASFRTRLACEGPVILSVSLDHVRQQPHLIGEPVWYQALDQQGLVWHCYGLCFLRLAPEARRFLHALLAHAESLAEAPELVGQRGADVVEDAYETRGKTSDRL
jgi:hypothetical protein